MTEELYEQAAAELEKAYTSNPMFLILSNFTPDVRTLVEQFWTDGFCKGVLAARLAVLKNNGGVQRH